MKIIKIIIPCLLFSACMLGTSKNAKFYTQSAISADVISADYNAFVGVNRIQLPKYLDRPQIVTQQKDSVQINISEYNRWVDSPAVLATRTLTEDLSVLLPAAQIKMVSYGEDFERTVSVDIVKIDAVLDEKVALVAWYTIKDKSKKILAQQKFSKMITIGKTYDDLAIGLSKLLNELSQEIATDLIKK